MERVYTDSPGNELLGALCSQPVIWVAQAVVYLAAGRRDDAARVAREGRDAVMADLGKIGDEAGVQLCVKGNFNVARVIAIAEELGV